MAEGETSRSLLASPSRMMQHNPVSVEEDEIPGSSSSPHLEQVQEQEQLPRTKSGGLYRCRTAPAMDMAAVLRDLQAQARSKLFGAAQDENDGDDDIGKDVDLQRRVAGKDSWKEMVTQAGILLLVYLSMGVLVYALNKDYFSGLETHPVVDALYFCIVTMCTIGYGDITPLTPSTKLFSCLFVLVGFGFIDILLSGVLTYVLDYQEKSILSDIHLHRYHPKHNYLLLVDLDKGRMRIRLKVAFALSVVFLCIGLGTLFLYFVEDFSWIDSLYLSALSVTTVGYGDRAFSTLSGRLFAAIWLLVSTLAVARAFLFLVEARVDKRQRTIAKWVLQREITPMDLFAANINNNNFIVKSEYVLYKLKEMGKIGEHDISQICKQFNKLDPNNLGRITLPDLLQNQITPENRRSFL